jgi:hypothetical protein
MKRFACIVTFFLKGSKKPEINHIIVKASSYDEAYQIGFNQLTANLPNGFLKFKTIEI